MEKDIRYILRDIEGLAFPIRSSRGSDKVGLEDLKKYKEVG